jgi:hypothetical protein
MCDSCLASSLYDPDWPQLRDPDGQAGAVDDVDHVGDVFVSLGHLLGHGAMPAAMTWTPRAFISSISERPRTDRFARPSRPRR